MTDKQAIPLPASTVVGAVYPPAITRAELQFQATCPFCGGRCLTIAGEKAVQDREIVCCVECEQLSQTRIANGGDTLILANLVMAMRNRLRRGEQEAVEDGMNGSTVVFETLQIADERMDMVRAYATEPEVQP